MAAGRGVWTPANVVTCVRIALIPVFMVTAELVVLEEPPVAPALALLPFVLYAALSLTDKLDGWLARSRGEVTDFGKFLDPIADKVLVFSALLLLLQWGYIGVWPVFLILFREFLVSALRMVASAKGSVIAADGLGKAKTAVTMVSLCGYFLGIALSALPSPPVSLAWMVLVASWALMVAAVVLTVVSGCQYFWNARHVILGGE